MSVTLQDVLSTVTRGQYLSGGDTWALREAIHHFLTRLTPLRICVVASVRHAQRQGIRHRRDGEGNTSADRITRRDSAANSDFGDS
jgi:hypothetical protein